MNPEVLSRRMQIAVVIIAALLLVIAASVIVWWMTPADVDDAAPSSAPTPAQSEPAAPAQSASDDAQSAEPEPAHQPAALISLDEAVAQADAALAAIADALADPASAVDEDLSSVLSGFALDEFNSQAEEWDKGGMYQSGRPVITDPSIIETAEDGSYFVLEACVDSSGVQVFNEAGMDLRQDQTTRWLMDFTFVSVEGAWKLDMQSFPDDPTC